MFFLKKLISAFLVPSTVCLLLIAVGLGLLWFTRRQRPGKILATVGLVLLLVISNTGLSDLLVGPLDRRTQPLHPEQRLREATQTTGARPVRFVVVLASGHTVDPRVPLTGQLDPASLARVMEGIRLHKQLPGSQLVLSGALGPRWGGPRHADALAAVASVCGVETGAMVLHRIGRDTEEEAASIVKVVGKEPFVLVTSATHMPRSLALFRHQGGHPIAAPTFLATLDEPGVGLNDWFPSPGALNDTNSGFHEYLGLLWSRLRGRL